MNYEKKYFTLNNLLLQKGGANEVETCFSSIEEFSKCQYSEIIQREQLVQNIRICIKPILNGIITRVRGDGYCMLNAVCTNLYLYMNILSTQNLLERFSSSLNTCYREKNFNTTKENENELVNNIISYIDSCKKLVKINFDTISNLILQKLMLKMGMDDINMAREIYEFKNRFDDSQPNYPFLQLGKVLSNVLDCVIISINIDSKKLYGTRPNMIDEDMSVDTIYEKVYNGEWKVVFLINLDQRHYNSFIPVLEGAGANLPIRDISIWFFHDIKERVEWL